MIYVVSDLHGQYELYKQLLDKINFSSDDTLYILGDIIDRGPDSVKLLLDIIDRDNVICCVGNHEIMMYSHEIGDSKNDCWFSSSNGGKSTKSQILKYDNDTQKRIFDYIFNNTFLQIELELNSKKYLLSHSFFVKDRGTIKDWKQLYSLDPNHVMSIVWSSPWRFWEYKSEEEYNDGRTHIIGHVPVQVARYTDGRPGYDVLMHYVADHIVNIDGGCAIIPKKKDVDIYNVGVICMNLTKYADGETGSFIYIQ